MSTKKSAYAIGVMQRYIFIGAALGLYYGIFYKPSDTHPDYGIAIILSIFAALITIAIRFWNKKQPFPVIIKDFFKVFILYSVFLLTLAARHLAEQIGGRFGVTLFTTLTGTFMGYLMATRNQFKLN